MMNDGTEAVARRIKILIVDDHPTMREGLAIRISRVPEFEVCGEASDGIEALKFLDQQLPDVAVVDITLKTGSGIDLVNQLKARNPLMRVLIWSMHVDSLYAERALRAGADGYINKEQATDQIIAAIHQILTGKIYLSDPMADLLLRRSIGGARATQGASPVELLSDCELETFRFIGEGLSTKEIAQQMDAHVRTVETYLARIKRKFHFESRQQLVHAAIQWVLEDQCLPTRHRSELGDASCSTS